MIDHEIDNLELEGLTLNQQAKNGLMTSAKWAKFLGIMTIIGAAFMFLGGIIATIMFSIMPDQGAMREMPFPPVLIGIIYLILGGFYLWFGLKLMKFSSNSIEAINETNGHKLGIGLENLGAYFKTMGILIIVFIALYIVAIIGFGIYSASIANAFAR